MIRRFLLIPILVLMMNFLVSPLLVRPVSAVVNCNGLGLSGIDDSKCRACEGAGGDSFTPATADTPATCNQPAGSRSFTDIFKSISNILIFIVGAAAVIILIISGLRYVLSGGDSAGVEGAKNGIIYAVVGLIVAFMSYAIINYVISKL